MNIKLETVFFIFIGIVILINAFWIIRTEKRLKKFFSGKKAKDLEEKFGESAGRVMVNIDEIDNRPLAAGDRVWLLLRAEDMDRSVIITDNTRIVAVITR